MLIAPLRGGHEETLNERGECQACEREAITLWGEWKRDIHFPAVFNFMHNNSFCLREVPGATNGIGFEFDSLGAPNWLKLQCSERAYT